MHSISSTDYVWPALKGFSGKIKVPFTELSVKRLKEVQHCSVSKI